ncbi:hypothetical protein ACVNIS_06575 [Sphaerotilaceae bacterium SBD11-9]
MPPAWDRTFVIKKLSTKQPGARKLALRYGPALVCVRHRHDADGRTRYTTVELLVEQTPIQRRKPDNQPVGVRLDPKDAESRRRIIAAGGQWDQEIHAWWLTRAAARRLRLLRRVVAVG